MFITKLLPQHVSGLIMPIIRRTRPVLLHTVFCTGYAGCGCVELGRKLRRTVSNLHTEHTPNDPAPHNHSQHNQCRTPYAVIHGLVLLMMGIMMPETCWDRSLVINIGLVASCWFISLHPMNCIVWVFQACHCFVYPT